MSPARTRNPAPTHGRPRSEIVVAVLAAVGIVAATIFLIWALRPKGVRAGTGGLITRQPRMTLLIIATGIVLGWVIWWLLMGRRRPRPERLGTRGMIVIACVVIIIVAVVVGIFWPGGVLRHYQSPPKVTTPNTTPATTPAATTPRTVVPTTKPASATPTTKGP